MNLPDSSTWAELFDMYLLNELNPQQQNQFQFWLKSDLQFANKFSQHQLLFQTIQTTGFKLSLQALEEANPLHKTLENQLKPNAKVNTLVWLSGLAAILVIVGYIIFLFQPTKDVSAIVAQNYEHYPNVINPTTRGAESDSSTLNLGVDAYVQGDFLNAIELLNQASANETDAEAARLLYLGLAYFENNSLDKAIVAFQKAILLPENDYQETLTWYLALSYLKNEDLKNGIDLLNQIIEQKGFYAAKAKSIKSNL